MSDNESGDSKSEKPTIPVPERVPTATSIAPESKGGEDPKLTSSEKWLWIDPLATDPRIKSGAVLLDDIIRKYIFDYNLLIDNKAFEAGKLKGGSYTMTPAMDDAWVFVPNDNAGHPDVKVALQKGRDHQGEFYWVPQNSLVYIKLEQRLRLPFYIIGRHNLKIRYVYKGLLLGTGPQVDPGFEGNLFIPLHNFTTSDVKVHIKQSFVSIDFVRTTRFVEEDEISAKTAEDMRKEMEAKGRKLIDAPKVKHRHTLEDYLEGSTPRSQMAQFHLDTQRLAARMETELTRATSELDRARTWGNWERLLSIVAFLGIVLTLLNLFHGFVNDIHADANEVKVFLANTNVNRLDARVLFLETNSIQTDDLVRNQMEIIKSNLLIMTSNVSQINLRMKDLELKTSEYQKASTNAR